MTEEKTMRRVKPEQVEREKFLGKDARNVISIVRRPLCQFHK